MDTAVEEGSEEAGIGREQETGFARKHLGKVSLVAQEPGSLSGAGRGGGRCHTGWLVESLEDIAKDLSLFWSLYSGLWSRLSSLVEGSDHPSQG